MNRGLLWLAAGAWLLLGAPGSAQETQPPSEIPLDGRTDASLAEIARQVHSPISPLWQLTFDNDIVGMDGGGLRDAAPAYTGSFEPTLPVPLSALGLGRFEWAAKLRVASRLTLPLIETLPVPGGGGGDARRTGIGDIQLGSVLVPNQNYGFAFGLGPNFIFPSASDAALGQGKWQAGPAAVVGYTGRTWTAYALAQQWWSFAGDRSRHSTNQLNLQYVLVRNLPERWQIGMQPTAAVDWTASPSNAVAFPVGLGLGRTLRLGGIPVQLWLEADYYAVHPDDLTGPRWDVELQITPVVPMGF
jgi:hypothetical protein